MNNYPSDAQKAAGNYKKKHLNFQGLNVAIETERGAMRSGENNGKRWEVKMPHDYGYIKRSEGADGDAVDVYLGHHKKSPHVFVIDQHKLEDGEFDEHKVMLGFANQKQAERAYDAGFSDGKGPNRRKNVMHMPLEDFKGWLKAGHAKKSTQEYADGGWVDMKPTQRSLPASADPAPKEEGSWLGETLSDIGSSAWGGLKDAASNVYEGLAWTPAQRLRAMKKAAEEEGITGLGKEYLRQSVDAGKGLLSVPGLVLDPLIKGTGAAYAHAVTGPVEAAMKVLPGGDKFDKKGFLEDQKKGWESALMAIPSASAISRLAPNVPRPAPAMAPIPNTIGDFNVPLTVGEATRDSAALAREQQALRGAMGERVQRLAQERIGSDPTSVRQQALQGARDRIGAQFDPQGQLLVTSPEEAGGLLQQSLTSARRTARSGVDDAYREFREVEGTFDPAIFRDQYMDQRISAYAFPEGGMQLNERLMPNATDALQFLRSMTRNASNNPDRAITIADADQARRALLQFRKAAERAARTGGDASDAGAMKRIVDGYDDFIQDALQLGYFSGDAAAAARLQGAARQAHTDYRQTFHRQGSDDKVGAWLERAIGRNPEVALEPQTIVREVLGAPATLGQKDIAPKAVRRLGEILGRDSAEFSALKQSAFQILTEFGEGRTPVKVTKDINSFLHGQGAQSARELFSGPERQLIERYGNLLRQMIPPAGAVQGSSHHVFWGPAMKAVLTAIGGTVGLSMTGGFGGLAVGAGATAAAQAAKPFLDARRMARQMPTLMESLQQWQRAQARLDRGAGDRVLTAASANLAKELSKIGLNGPAIMKEINASRPVAADEDSNKKRERN